MLLRQRADAEHRVLTDAEITDSAEREAADGANVGMVAVEFVGLDALAAGEDGPALVGVERCFTEPCVEGGAVALFLVGECAGERPPAALAERARIYGAGGETLFVFVGMQRFWAFDVGP